MYKMNFVLEKQCFQTFRKKFNLHSNTFPNNQYLLNIYIEIVMYSVKYKYMQRLHIRIKFFYQMLVDQS